MARKDIRGFSLVEISLALGVAAFCLVAIFALLPIGLKGNLESSEETAATGVLSLVVADLSASPMTVPPGAATNSPQFGIPIPANPVSEATAAPARYFSESGYDGTSRLAGSQFRLDVTFLPTVGAKSATMARVKASWPAAAPNPSGKVETLVALDRN